MQQHFSRHMVVSAYAACSSRSCSPDFPCSATGFPCMKRFNFGDLFENRKAIQLPSRHRRVRLVLFPDNILPTFWDIVVNDVTYIGLSIPIPKAMVATITCTSSSRMHPDVHFAWRHLGRHWYGKALIPLPVRFRRNRPLFCDLGNIRFPICFLRQDVFDDFAVNLIGFGTDFVI